MGIASHFSFFQETMKILYKSWRWEVTQISSDTWHATSKWTRSCNPKEKNFVSISNVIHNIHRNISIKAFITKFLISNGKVYTMETTSTQRSRLRDMFWYCSCEVLLQPSWANNVSPSKWSIFSCSATQCSFH